MKSPVLVAHVVPDADALGAMFALARAWPSSGAGPKVALPDGSLSQRLAFLFELASVPVASPEDFVSADGFVVLDTAGLKRCNVGAAKKHGDWCAGRTIVNIDHHATNTRFGQTNWVVPDASSTSELVYFYLRATARPIDACSASLLYAGIQTDTIGFSLPTTSASTLLAAAELVDLGADVERLGDRLCRSLRKSEFDLLRVIYANTRLAAGGQVGYSSASFDEIHGAGCSAADIDDQINVPRSLEGVRLAMLFTEGNKGRTRINFRSSGDVTVLDLAAEFDGGGHIQAAGAIMHAPLQDAMEQVVPRAVAYVSKFPA